MSIKKILIKSFDSLLTQKEEERLESELVKSEKLRREKFLVEKLRVELFALQTLRFSSGFKDSLLEKIRLRNYPQIFFYREIGFAFKKFVFAAILLITLLVIYNFDVNNKVTLLGGEKLRMGEVINNDYFISFTKLKGDKNGL